MGGTRPQEPVGGNRPCYAGELQRGVRGQSLLWCEAALQIVDPQNFCSPISWRSAERPPCGGSPGALSTRCQPVMFLLQKNDVLGPLRMLSAGDISIFVDSLGQTQEPALWRMTCSLCGPIHKNNPCLRSRTVVLTWRRAQLILSLGKLPQAAVLPCTRAGTRKIPFLPRAYTAARFGYWCCLNLGLGYVTVSPMLVLNLKSPLGNMQVSEELLSLK